jgi:hypothetical protein
MGHLTILTGEEIESIGSPKAEELADVGVPLHSLSELALKLFARLLKTTSASVAAKSLILVVMVVVCASGICGQTSDKAQVTGKRITLVDGRTLIVDEAWRQGAVVWYTRKGLTQSLDGGVKRIESVFTTGRHQKDPALVSARTAETKTNPQTSPSIWIHLVSGARFKVDEVNETSAGAWYSRGTLSAFLERERIALIDRAQPGSLNSGGRNRDWTSGNARIDELIKTNSTRYGVDPYLVFCVIEHESHFKSRAVSSKGARGLMQLMPATARRFGVKLPFDAADNIKGGTQYLRELIDMFGGEVNLVLAGYNAGEGAVMKFGRNIPPYRETREYVKRIGKRYGLEDRSIEPVK